LHSIIICKPDKRNCVVVFDRKNYIKKMGTILKDKTKFQPRKGNANLENLKKFQAFLSRLKKKGVLDDSVYNQIRPTAAFTPTLYGLPKVHKDNVPLRPILWSIGSLTYQCASWLSKSLKELRRQPSTAKDTFHFIKMIADHELGCNHIMCSFDVKNLFTNIIVDFTVNLILDKVFAEKESKVHGLNQTDLRKMFNWTCKNTVQRKILYTGGWGSNGFTDCTFDGRCIYELVD